MQEIGQQDDLALVDWIPNHHAPQEMGTVLDRLRARKADEFIGQDVVRQRSHGGFHHRIGGVVLQSRHEEHIAVGPLAEQRVVVIAPVHGHDGTGIEIQRLRHADIALLGFSDQDVGRQVVVVVQEHMRFHAPFGPAELGPREQVQAQRDGGGVQRQKFVFETELGLAGAHALLLAETVQRGIEQVFE